MLFKKYSSICFGIIVATFAGTAEVIYAGTITDFGPGMGAGTATCDDTDPMMPGIQTPFPNNDDFVQDGANGPNNIACNKTFTSINPIDIQITVTNSGGVTEYKFSEAVINNTGITWDDFHFELGFGVGEGFIPSGMGDGLDFDTPIPNPAPTSDSFEKRVHKSDSIWWSKGKVDPGSFDQFMFSIDVPDNANIPDDFTTPAGYVFTLRQIPTVPEPTSTLGLLALGTLGAASTLKRKIKPSKSSEKETEKLS